MNRLEALKLAVERHKVNPGMKTQDILQTAQDFAIFLTGEDNSGQLPQPSTKRSAGRPPKKSKVASQDPE